MSVASVSVALVSVALVVNRLCCPRRTPLTLTSSPDPNPIPHLTTHLRCLDAYDVFYRAVPGLTFSMCQHAVPKKGTPLPDDIMKGFVEAIKYLDQEKNVSGSTRLTPRTRFG